MVHLFVVYGYQGAEEDALRNCSLLISFFRLSLLKLRWFVLVSPCLLMVILMLILLLFPVLLRVFLLVGMLIWLLLILLVLVLLLMLLVGLVGRMVLGLVGIFLWAVPVLLLLLRLVMLLIGGSLLTFQFLLAFVLVPGWLMLPAPLYVSLFGLLVGWILLIGPPRRLLELSRMFGMFIGMYSVWFQRRLFLLFGMLSLGLLLMIFGLFGVVVLRMVYFGLIL